MNNPIIDKYGNKRWYKDDQFHREDGPACEYNNGTVVWYYKDRIHRLNGPAIIYYNGFKEWWYENKYIKCSSQKEFEQYLKLRMFW